MRERQTVFVRMKTQLCVLIWVWDRSTAPSERERQKTVHLTVVKAKSSSSFSLWTGLFFWKSMLQSNKQQSLKKSAYKISLHINPFYFPHYDANAKQRACMSRPLFFSFQSFKNSETETWISHWLLWPVSAFSICQVLTV